MKARSTSAMAAAVLLGGCATILGIDHDYGDREATGPGGSDAGSPLHEGGSTADSGSAGGSSSGGNAAGGNAGTGGRRNGSGGASDGGASGSGGTSASSGGGGGENGSSGGEDAGVDPDAGGVRDVARLDFVQTGTTRLQAGSSAQSVPIQTVDPARAFLVFGAAFDSTSATLTEATGQITGPTELTFRRNASANTPEIPIRYYVAQFQDGVSVQRGSRTLNLATERIELATSVDRNRSFPLISFRNAGSVYGLDDFVRAELTSSTELSLSMYQAFGVGVVEWQVVSFEGASVQFGNVSLGADELVVSAVPAQAVDPARTWIVTTYEVAGEIDSAAELMIQGLVEDEDELAFERSGAGTSAEITYYSISFDNGTTVRSGNRVVTGGSATTPLTPPVDPLFSIAVAGGVYQRAGTAAYSTASNPGYATFNLNILGGDELGFGRGASGTSATVSWFAIDFR